jgi:hypothetical protein
LTQAVAYASRLAYGDAAMKTLMIILTGLTAMVVLGSLSETLIEHGVDPHPLALLTVMLVVVFGFKSYNNL